jgi:lysozyme family protein
MPSTDQIITDIINREGPATNDPNDKGGRTAFGIAESANPQAWADGRVTEEEAREIYLTKYVKGPGFDKIEDPRLQAQVVDFGVNSGPHLAIMKLQAACGLPQDGVLGPKTLGAVNSPTVLSLNNKLVAERIKMIGRIVSKDPSQLKFVNGWLNRALEFLI